MIIVNGPLSQDLLSSAQAFSEFRANCKAWLQRYGLCFDKFTVVTHDSFIGYISERLICLHLQALFPDALIHCWEEAFDLERIRHFIAEEGADRERQTYVQRYFYDRWDIAITLGERTIYADVKTALTRKTPRADWSFLYPVIQAEKGGKDIAVLAYYIAHEGTQSVADFRELAIAGYVSEASIRNCPIIKAGERTVHRTVSNVDNYETKLSEHYRPLNNLFD